MRNWKLDFLEIMKSGDKWLFLEAIYYIIYMLSLSIYLHYIHSTSFFSVGKFKVVLLKVWSQLSVNKNIIFILQYLRNILKR